MKHPILFNYNAFNLKVGRLGRVACPKEKTDALVNLSKYDIQGLVKNDPMVMERWLGG